MNIHTNHRLWSSYKGMGEAKASYGEMPNFKFHKNKQRKWRQGHRHGWRTERKQKRMNHVRKEFEREKRILLNFH